MATGLPFAPSGAPGGQYGLGLPFGTTQAPPAATSLPGVNFAVDTVARPNSYIGLNSFVSVVSHYVAIHNPSDSQGLVDVRKLGIGMMVFARDTSVISTTSQARAIPIYGVNVGPNTVEMKELTQVNNFLKRQSDRYSTAAEVAAEWRLLGVIKNEAANVYEPTYGRAASSRIINCVCSHRVSVLNYWAGCRILQTQNLWLIIKRNPLGVWQITPWTSPNMVHPSLSDLTYQVPGSDFEEIGVAVYVGKSSDQTHSLQSVNTKNTTNADVANSLVERGMLDSIEIYLSI